MIFRIPNPPAGAARWSAHLPLWQAPEVTTGEVRCRRLVVVDTDGAECIVAEVTPDGTDASIDVRSGDVAAGLFASADAGAQSSAVSLALGGNGVVGMSAFERDDRQQASIDVSPAGERTQPVVDRTWPVG